MTASNQADTMRGDYERWRVSQGFNFVQADFDVWQASAKVSRKAALTEAAELCRQAVISNNPGHVPNEYYAGRHECAQRLQEQIEGTRDAS